MLHFPFTEAALLLHPRGSDGYQKWSTHVSNMSKDMLMFSKIQGRLRSELEIEST